MLRRFESYFVTSDNQFGFKKQTGCSHAIFTVRSVINHYTAHGSTVNLCAVDISKAFDRMNRFGLLCTLMDRLLPVNILQLLEDWFAKCFTCVKWNLVTSCFLQLTQLHNYTLPNNNTTLISNNFINRMLYADMY